MYSEKKERIVQYKVLFTVMVLLSYILGRKLVLYGVDSYAFPKNMIDAQSLLMQTIGGDTYRYSLFALGISPYMTASIIVQVISYCKKSLSNAKISPSKVAMAITGLTLGIAVLQAVEQVGKLPFKTYETMQELVIIAAMVQMVAGAMLIMRLAQQNKKYGIGGQSILILVNILDGMIKTMTNGSKSHLVIAIFLSLLVLIFILIMENGEKRIPVQRVSIHNIYSDKNYLAIKLNPVGVMPIMFSTALFMIPQFLIDRMAQLFPTVDKIQWCQQNLTLSHPLGITCYLGIIIVLTIVTSVLALGPGELTEQLLKSGDSIVNFHAGMNTKKYLQRTIFRLGLGSAMVMGTCAGIPLILQVYEIVEGPLVMLPSSVMMAGGLWCGIFREYEACKSLEAYRPIL